MAFMLTYCFTESGKIAPRTTRVKKMMATP